MCMAVNSHALPVYKKNRIVSLPCIFETTCTITMSDFISLLFGPFIEVLSNGHFHLCPRMDFLQTLHIDNSLYTNYENVFIELDIKNKH